MNEKFIKELCKLSVRSNKYISDWDKECIATAIDCSKSIFDLFIVTFMYNNTNPR